MTIVETRRLALRRMTGDDAAFIFELVNDPSWLQYIGDKGVRTLADARRYIENGPVAMYERVGFGLYVTQLKESGTPIGICGPIKRDTLADVDLGFALLPRFRGCGYAVEAAAAVIGHAESDLGLLRIVAITSPGNDRSIKLLLRLGLRFERALEHAGGDGETLLFARQLGTGQAARPLNESRRRRPSTASGPARRR